MLIEAVTGAKTTGEFFFWGAWGAHPWHVDVPGPGIELTPFLTH